jgi:hypothetical protein
VTLLAPRHDEPRLLEAGQKYVLPSRPDETLRVTEPTGLDELFLLCSPEWFDLAELGSGLGGELAAASVVYEIRP